MIAVNRAGYRLRRVFRFLIRHSFWVVLLQFIEISAATVSFAAPPLPTWSVSTSRTTSFAAPVYSSIVLSSAGEMFLASGPTYAPEQACTTPTLAVGNASQQSSCVTKFSASGQTVFSVQIGGAGINAIVLNATGDVYVSGLAGPTGAGFATTEGVYEPNPPGEPDPFLCKLSGADGHPLFCTFIDVAISGSGGTEYTSSIALDSAGNAYIAGLGCNSLALCVEKIDGTGSSVEYRSVVQTPSAYSGSIAVAVDMSGDLYCLCNGLVELDPSGTMIKFMALGGELGMGLALDPTGNPEVLLEDKADLGTFRVRKYSVGFSTVLFNTPFVAGPYSSVQSISIDPSGAADIVGEATAINLTQVSPTKTCAQPLPPPTLGLDAFLVRVDSNGSLLQSTYLQQPVSTAGGPPQAALVLTPSGAYGAFWAPFANVTIMTLAPSNAAIALGCIGNAASLAAMPLAPNEIVSAFGVGLGPSNPITAQLDPSGRYPSQLGAIEITFDGVPAPLLYASSSQVNLVTPGTLKGKSTTQVCAVVGGAVSNCLTAIVAPAAPGIFTSGSLFQGAMPYAAAVNQNGTVNSPRNPAPPGSVVTLFATGLGSMTPSPSDGSITSSTTPSQDLSTMVNVFEQHQDEGFLPVGNTPVLYAGPAPLEVEGLSQINIVVPGVPMNGAPVIDFQVFVTGLGNLYSGTGALVWTRRPARPYR